MSDVVTRVQGQAWPHLYHKVMRARAKRFFSRVHRLVIGDDDGREGTA